MSYICAILSVVGGICRTQNGGTDSCSVDASPECEPHKARISGRPNCGGRMGRQAPSQSHRFYSSGFFIPGRTLMTKRVNTRATKARNKRVIRDGAGICHLCGHPGADAADHVVPLSRGGADDLSNLRPAHHFEPCPVCGVKCNRVKSGKLVAPVIRRSRSISW